MSSDVLGKISSEFFDHVIRARLGRPDPSVLVGPQNGVDSAIVDLGANQVMAITTDPFFVVPEYGWKRAGWFAVHILASDVSTSGFAPRYLTVDLNLPPGTSNDELEALWNSVHESCSELGVSVVTGHTGRYEGCAYPMVGGATMMATGERESYVASSMAQPGDAVIVTKGAAIEATALMAATFPELVGERVGAELAAEAEKLFWSMSTVQDALVAVTVGVRSEGVTGMHDATEGGVLGGLCEIAHASQIGMRIDAAAVPIREEVRSVCDAFDMAPLASISEGSLLITCRPQRAEELLRALSDASVEAARIGECTSHPDRVLEIDGRATPLAPPEFDPFWPAFAKAATESRK